MCGGDIELSSDKTFGLCDSCGSTTTLPKIDDEQKAGLFNRGNILRIRGEFDKAAAVFERIIEQDETDAEAHWCLALCRHGIEYVEDPKSRECLPTCHRASYNSFFNDVDYIAAVEHSDSYTASLYTMEAKKIAEIQKVILAISNQEEPFDLFICYKETDEGGSRTKDSALAQEIYYELTNAGYKVFFSRITLEDKLGSEYEPYIFAALNSAKVMMVIGTSSDHFNATWVKNEWSRFLSLMRADHSRMLIPCYRDMDPYDLPDELAMLQSQDMSKIGFIQDITRGIKKILDSAAPKESSKTSAGMVSITSQERLVQNSETYLRLNNYSAAQEVFALITKEYPEDHRGWWGLIVCATTNFNEVIEEQDTLNTWFGYVKQLTNAEEFAPLKSQYVTYAKKVADVDADNEKISITNNIKKIVVRIRTLQERRQQAEYKQSQLIADFETQTAEDNCIISDIQKNIADGEEALAEFKGGRIVSKIVLVFGFIVLFLGGGTSFVGIVLLGVLLILLGFYGVSAKKDGKNSEEWEKSIENAHLKVKQAEMKKEMHKKQCTEDLEKLDKLIENINDEIVEAECKIVKCQKYIDYGKDKMSEMFFAFRCMKFGVEQAYDNETFELRKSSIG